MGQLISLGITPEFVLVWVTVIVFRGAMSSATCLAARAKAAGLQPEIEKANLRPPRPELQGGVEDGGRRLADIWVPHWNLRGPFDLAVASGLRQGHLAASVADGSRATMDYEVRKCQVGACSGCRSLCRWLALSSIGRMPGRAFAT